MPREAKAKTQDRVLVFAEGRQAEEAKRAGADIVGGPEIIDGVRDTCLRSVFKPELPMQSPGGKWALQRYNVPVHHSTHTRHYTQTGQNIGTQRFDAI